MPNTAPETSNNVKLTAFDRKLLSALEVDGRASIATLARKVGASPGTVRYRLLRLEREGAIAGYPVVINPAKFGYCYFKLYANFRGDSPQDKLMFLNWLKARQCVTWAARLDGTFNVGVSIFAPTANDAQAQIDHILARWGKNISACKKVVNLYAVYLAPRLFGTSEGTRKFAYQSVSSNETPLTLDDESKRVLYHLSLTPRAPISELALRTGLTSEVVVSRIKKLRNEGVLVGVTLRINSPRVNQYHYKLLLHLRNALPSNVQRIISFLCELPYVTYVVRTMGDWDVEFDIEVASPEAFRRLAETLSDKFSDAIDRYDSLYVYEVAKYQLYPLVPPRG